MGDVRTRRARILAVVEDLATNFLYYDRKESQSLPMGDLEAAVEAGEISWQDIGDAFTGHLPAQPSQPAMPVFVIKAKDALAPSAVAAYRNLCTEYGLHGQASEVQLAYNEIDLWQQDHEEQVRLPDHKHVPVGA